MTGPAPAPTRPPAPARSWPSFIDGKGALVVNCALDPEALLAKVPGLSWLAFKTGGSDVASDPETAHCRQVWERQGKQVGAWVDCVEPTADVEQLSRWAPLPFVIYDVEARYKADEPLGRREYAAQLVAEHRRRWGDLPAAVTSYGGYKDSIDFGSFCAAGWPILAQVYDSFADGDELTYRVVYPTEAIHRLTRRLTLSAGESVYRPESVDT